MADIFAGGQALNAKSVVQSQGASSQNEPDGALGSLLVAAITAGAWRSFAPAIPGEVPPVAIARYFYPDKNAPCAAAPEVAYQCLFAAIAERHGVISNNRR